MCNSPATPTGTNSPCHIDTRIVFAIGRPIVIDRCTRREAERRPEVDFSWAVTFQSSIRGGEQVTSRIPAARFATAPNGRDRRDGRHGRACSIRKRRRSDWITVGHETFDRAVTASGFDPIRVSGHQRQRPPHHNGQRHFTKNEYQTISCSPRASSRRE